jgi:formamidase
MRPVLPFATMSRILTVLAAQVRPVPFDPAATLEKFEEEVRMLRGAFPDVDLYIFPELYLTGEHPFSRPPTGYDENPQAIPGPLTRAVGRIAKRAGRWIVAGSIVERDGDDLYNTAIVFAPSGRLAARYRKVFTWRPFERYTAGIVAPPVFSIPNVAKVGLMICYDGWFPEMARGLALRGAEVIAHPTLTSTPDREEELVLARANAITNQCYVINPNAVITVGGGRSIGVDPEGRVLFTGGSGEEFIPEVLDLDRVRTVRERGTRGLNRVLRHVRDAPRAVFDAYDDLGRD